MTTIQIRLSDQLAQEAQLAGLLSETSIERLLREALRSGRVERMKQAREQLAADPLPPMSHDEIEAEIDAYRAEARRAAGS
jgi:hypothetical protein